MSLHGTQIRLSTDVRAAVQERRSIRSFRDDPVPSELVRELLVTASWAPSPHNSQPWRFTVLTRRADKQALAVAMAYRMAAELRVEGVDDLTIRRQAERSCTRISDAPIVILCSLSPDGLATHQEERRSALEWQMAVQSMGAALQTLFLLADQEGLGTCWMAAPMYCPDVVRSALDLDPELSPQALVLMGYPATAGKMRARRSPEDAIDFR
ncbi:MAG: nitroreductase family protein [Chloroflexota bacterium]|nr:MAG: nitroreductase [Chloroflexota bacterium]